MKLLALTIALLLSAAVAAMAEPSTPPAPKAGAGEQAAPSATAGKAASTNVVRYANDKVTIDVKGMAAAALVDEIARQAGAKVTGSVDNVAPITASWTDLPLKDALEHTLGAQNFTLTYSDKGELRVIQLRGGQQAQEGGPGVISPDDKNRVGTAEYALFKAFDIREPVPVEGAMAKKLGKSKAPLDLLANTSIADDDPAVRLSGMKSMMHMYESDQELQDKVTATTSGMSDAQLAAFARAYLYHWAENFVHNIKRTTTQTNVRQRASGVLRELRKIPFTGPKPLAQ